MSRVALVSGGNRGIGRAIAEGLAAGGLTVVAGARDPARVDGGVEVQQLDITDQGSVDAAIAAIGERHGRLDVLVNSAGILLDAGERGDRARSRPGPPDARRQPDRHVAADRRRTGRCGGRPRRGSSA